ncbi:aminotransferase class I/II-fold pyridoxal phosphate-dependent enzyme [Nocardia transvalensis]|uniref:aminotransferase class I/II-fold pyridoxal phosphate-dependent enzyme n=1 Tax=Nocardia transvalensis TaxID=37333 RepID=UPI00189639A6|nr:aminotransferase class I/II-fold pyridoxal phosphate-dependent enzyme [Nocardia transvalensis]MBF6333044.1 aminotransferase class I/II-fold pyridoxal phosphate-dependent enzyme [Nocardia transvalensis]
MRIAEGLTDLAEYRQDGERADQVVRYDLSNNDMPFCPLPGVRCAIEEQIAGVFRYPDPGYRALRSALSRHCRVPVDGIAVGNGSVEVLRTIIRCVSNQGDRVVFAAPGFDAYARIVLASGAIPRMVAGGPGCWQPLEALLAAVDDDTSAILVSLPHNPSGETVAADEFVEFLRAVPDEVVVIVDQAYTEFSNAAGQFAVDELIAQFPDLVVTRTFSKVYGLAALRVGYAVGTAAFMSRVRACALPFAVNSLAASAAVESLCHPAELADRVRTVRTVRGRLRRVLGEAGYDGPPSQGNFVWVPTRETEKVVRMFRAGGIAVRDYPGVGVRVTATTEEALAAVSHALYLPAP